MKRNEYRTSALCPYYKRETGHGVVCHGIMPESSIHVTFGCATACKGYKDNLCRGAYKTCKVYAMLEDLEQEKGGE